MAYVPSIKSQTKKRTTYNISKRTGKPIYEPGNISHIFNDAARGALPPGWRKSVNGNWYYEARINRADNVSDTGYIVYVNPKTGKQIKIKDTPANRKKLEKTFGKHKRTSKSKNKTVTSKKRVVKPQPKKTHNKRPKIRRTGLRGTRAKARIKTQAYKRTARNTEKIPFELVSLYKTDTAYIGYIKTLTGNKKSFSVRGTLKSLKFRVDSNTITETSFNRIMEFLINEGVFKQTTLEEKKKAIRYLEANGWTKYNAQREYLNKIVRDTKKALAKKETEAKKRAENKIKKEDRQKKALEYKAPRKQTPSKVDATPTVKIDEKMASYAKESRSFSEYKKGSATEDYNSYIESAARKVNEHKAKVDPIHWPEIDSKFELYKKRIGEWINEQNRIEASMPAWFIAGPSNYNVKKWNKVQAREDAHYKEYEVKVQGLLDRILRIGSTGAISSDDKQAVQKIDSKLEKLERDQELMKMANAYYRKHATLDGCGLPDDIVSEGKKNIANAIRWYGDGLDIKKDRKQFISWTSPFGGAILTNNSANIRRLKERNEQLKKSQTAPAKPDVSKSWGTIVRNKEENRLQLLFNSVPDVETRNLLKSHGFRWSPKNKAWQRQLTGNAEFSLKNYILPKLGS